MEHISCTGCDSPVNTHLTSAGPVPTSIVPGSHMSAGGLIAWFISGDGLVVAYTFEHQSLFHGALILDKTGKNYKNT